MPVHIEEMTSDVTILDGDLPLSQEQIEKLVKIELKQLEAKQREARQSSAATSVRRESAPPTVVK
jgi:hypothetical protein